MVVTGLVVVSAAQGPVLPSGLTHSNPTLGRAVVGKVDTMGRSNVFTVVVRAVCVAVVILDGAGALV